MCSGLWGDVISIVNLLYFGFAPESASPLLSNVLSWKSVEPSPIEFRFDFLVTDLLEDVLSLSNISSMLYQEDNSFEGWFALVLNLVSIIDYSSAFFRLKLDLDPER